MRVCEGDLQSVLLVATAMGKSRSSNLTDKPINPSPNPPPSSSGGVTVLLKGRSLDRLSASRAAAQTQHRRSAAGAAGAPAGGGPPPGADRQQEEDRQRARGRRPPDSSGTAEDRNHKRHKRPQQHAQAQQTHFDATTNERGVLTPVVLCGAETPAQAAARHRSGLQH